MQIAGFGLIKVYNNIIESAEWDGSAQRQDALYIGDNSFPSSEYAEENVYVFNNTILNANPKQNFPHFQIRTVSLAH